MTQQDDLDRFYDLLDRLESRIGSPMSLESCLRGGRWPEDNIHFLFEPGEYRAGRSRLRVVRIGYSGDLQTRLKQYWGIGKGKSVLRKHVARIKMKKAGIEFQEEEIDSIMRSDERVKKLINDYVRKMSFLYADVSKKENSYNLIMQMACSSIILISDYHDHSDSPSDDWLGLSSRNEKISKSGLWNEQNVKHPYDSRSGSKFLDLLESCIKDTKPLFRG